MSQVFELISEFLLKNTGLSVTIISALSLGIAVLYYLGNSKQPVTQDLKRVLLIIVPVILLLVFVSIKTKNDFYKPYNVEPEWCLSRTSNGRLIKISCRYNVHPQFGTSILVPTPELLSEFYNQSNIMYVDLPFIDQNTQFVSNSGAVLFWWYKSYDGKIELYNFPGNHPQFPGVQLKPIDKHIIQVVLQDIKGNRNIIVNPSRYKSRNEPNVRTLIENLVE